jgi:hypothetical protein
VLPPARQCERAGEIEDEVCAAPRSSTASTRLRGRGLRGARVAGPMVTKVCFRRLPTLVADATVSDYRGAIGALRKRPQATNAAANPRIAGTRPLVSPRYKWNVTARVITVVRQDAAMGVS